MTSLIEWLLDLDNISLAHDAPLLLKWNSPLAAWLLFAVSVLALVWIVLAYRREPISTVGRTVCATLRCGLVALVLAVICRPSLVLQRNRIEPSYVVLAIDNSQSMALTDQQSSNASPLSAAGTTDGRKLDASEDKSRIALLREALLADAGAPLKALLSKNGVQLCRFAGHLESVGFYTASDDVEGMIRALSDIRAVGLTTDTAGAIRHIVEKTQGRRLAAIVFASDGQATQPTSLKDALDLARDRHIPIFPIRVGSTHVPWDIAVGPVRSKDSVFVNDVLAVEVQLHATGLASPTAVTVNLFEEGNLSPLSTETVILDPDTPSVTVELRTKPTRTGQMQYRVEAPVLDGELTATNNTDHVDIKVLDSRFSVLYVEGYPRYEYRYLKNALLREKTLDLSVLLIDADERFVQEGTDPIRRFPETPEELNRYDVVLFGDVDPRSGWLTRAQMNMLLDFVGNQGGGFGLIAGERSAPLRLLGTPLEKLVPVRIDPTLFAAAGATFQTGFTPRLTLEGRRSRIFRFAADRVESENLFRSLPNMFWFARTLGPKPSASVLAEHPTIRCPDRSSLGNADPMPLVVTGRYGAGKLFFQATDDTWRWRRHTGEFLHDTYWIQVARDLMPETRVARKRRLALRADRRVYTFGSPVRIQAEIFDSQLLAEQGPAFTVTLTEHIRPESGSALDVVGRLALQRIGRDSNLFEGSWIPPRPGNYIVQAAEIAPDPADQPISVPLRVNRPDLESQRAQANHAALERMASATNGKVLELDQLESGFGDIQDRSIQIPDDIEEPLWDSKLVLVLFVTMISMEWATRKALGLL